MVLVLAELNMNGVNFNTELLELLLLQERGGRSKRLKTKLSASAVEKNSVTESSLDEASSLELCTSLVDGKTQLCRYRQSLRSRSSDFHDPSSLSSSLDVRVES